MDVLHHLAETPETRDPLGPLLPRTGDGFLRAHDERAGKQSAETNVFDVIWLLHGGEREVEDTDRRGHGHARAPHELDDVLIASEGS